ncbi:MAG TPA: bifunctional UDP-N-acetylglucosamine diphosphorylase/glucosamine-1-phosphate N-acetyltransferase GlmU [Candidatus Dormibacteraeota bacterium]|nr:bifunctional UDP-N-acetylglucosamine diphosphorylase/glucosamine-1-phosphate N-acetyltransferase GlmU [Candidatus Dormibacteraeota bacterium]
MAEGTVRAVILAAGRGTRMASRRSKVLHPVGGVPMIEHLIRAAAEAVADQPLVVVSPEDLELRRFLEGKAEIVLQEAPRGTGDALLAARSALAGQGAALVLAGDMPLLTSESLRQVLEVFQHSAIDAALLVAEVADASSFGRVVRDGQGRLARILEAADEADRPKSAEVNCGVYVFRLPQVWGVLDSIPIDNAQAERYLSWAPERMVGGAELVSAGDPTESLQVNDRIQLAAAEAAMRQRTLHRLMRSGVTVIDPSSTWVDCDVEVGQDTVIHPGTVIRGRSVIGADCQLGPFAELDGCQVGAGSRIGRSSLRGCKLETGVEVGPFNRVRAGTVLGSRSHLGTFTEVVRSRIGAGSQVPHLSYVGDAELGDDVNVGAGTITANWDGQSKQRTVIEQGARLGSDTILVAPITIGQGAYTAAGSVLTTDVPAGSLAVSRSPQKNLEGWVARRRPDSRPVTEVAGEEEE